MPNKTVPAANSRMIPLPANAPRGPLTSTSTPPTPAPSAMANWIAATWSPPMLSVSSGTALVTHVVHVTGTIPNANPQPATRAAATD